MTMVHPRTEILVLAAITMLACACDRESTADDASSSQEQESPAPESEGELSNGNTGEGEGQESSTPAGDGQPATNDESAQQLAVVTFEESTELCDPEDVGPFGVECPGSRSQCFCNTDGLIVRIESERRNGTDVRRFRHENGLSTVEQFQNANGQFGEYHYAYDDRDNRLTRTSRNTPNGEFRETITWSYSEDGRHLSRFRDSERSHECSIYDPPCLPSNSTCNHTDSSDIASPEACHQASVASNSRGLSERLGIDGESVVIAVGSSGLTAGPGFQGATVQSQHVGNDVPMSNFVEDCPGVTSERQYQHLVLTEDQRLTIALVNRTPDPLLDPSGVRGTNLVLGITGSDIQLCTDDSIGTNPVITETFGAGRYRIFAGFHEGDWARFHIQIVPGVE